MNRIFVILIAIVVAAAVAGGAYHVTDATPRKSPDTSHLSGVEICGLASPAYERGTFTVLQGYETVMQIVELAELPKGWSPSDSLRLCTTHYRRAGRNDNPELVTGDRLEEVRELLKPVIKPDVIKSPTPPPSPIPTATPELMTSGVLAMVASCPKGYSHEHWSNGSSSYSCLIEQWERDYAEDFGDVVTDEPVRIHDHNKGGYWGYGGVLHSH